MTDASGLNVADSTYQFEFRFYTVSSGGSAVWSETVNLDTVDGIFQHYLGSSTALPGSVDFNTDNIYLGITFNSDAAGEMDPRIQLSASPYAFNSDQLDGLDAEDFVQLNPSVAQTGDIEITGDVAASSITLDDGSSNTGTIVVDSLGGNYTYTIPTTAGNDEFCLVNAGNCPAASNSFIQGGNSFGTTAVLGTNDSNELVFETGGTARWRISTGGSFYPDVGNTYAIGSGSNEIGSIYMGSTGSVILGSATGSYTDPWSGSSSFTRPQYLNGNYSQYSALLTGVQYESNIATAWATYNRWGRYSADGFQQIFEIRGSDTDQRISVYDATTSTEDIRLSVTGNSYINTGSNFGIGDTTPAALLTVGTSDAFQVNSSGNVQTSGTLTTAGLITANGGISSPGTGSNSEQFGLNADASGNNSVAIGDSALAGGGGGAGNVAIGYQATASASFLGTDAIAIGWAASATSENTIAIGRNSNADTYGTISIGNGSSATDTADIALGVSANASGSSSVAIGSSASSSGISSAAIGSDSAATGFLATALGAGAFSDHDNSIALGGYAATTAANQLVIGSIEDIYVGSVTNATPTDFTLNATGGDGTDIAGGDITIAGGRGTGTGAGGDILLQTASAGSTGTSLNSLTTRVTIQGSGGVIVNSGDLTVGTTSQAGTLAISDGSSNTATITVDALAGNYSVAIPTITGNDEFCLASANNCSVPTNAFIQGGNSFGATAVLGTDDAYDLQLKAGGTTGITIGSSGNVGINSSVYATDKLSIGGIAPDVSYGGLVRISGLLTSSSNPQIGLGIFTQIAPSSASTQTKNGLTLQPSVTNGNLAGGSLNAAYFNGYITGSGDLGLQTQIRISGGNLGSGTITNARGIAIGDRLNSGGGAITNTAGIEIANQTTATNNTNLLLGTSTVPSGNYSIYNSSTYNNYFAGNLGVGSTDFTTAPVRVNMNAPDASNSSIFYVTGNLTTTTNTQSGMRVVPTIAPGSASSLAYYGAVFGPSSNSANLTSGSLVGGIMAPYFHAAASTLGSATGGRFYVTNASTGTITTAHGIVVSEHSNASGTITNARGISIANQTTGTHNSNLVIGSGPGSGNYSIYNSSAYSNYFAGNLGINNAGAPNVLSVNTLSTADAAAQLAVATGGTGNKGLIIQGSSGQTANYLEVQNNTGAVVSAFRSTGLLDVSAVTGKAQAGASFATGDKISLYSNGAQASSYGIGIASFRTAIYAGAGTQNGIGFVRAGSGASYSSGEEVFSFITDTGAQVNRVRYTDAVGIEINAPASYTADYLQLKDNSSNVLTGFDANGYLYYTDSGYIVTINTETLTDNATISLPNTSGISDTICLETLANCGGGGLSATLPDNSVDSWDIQEGSNNYININTTNSSENISFGNATTNPSFNFLGSGTLTVAGPTNFSSSIVVAASQSIRLTGGNTASRPGSPSEGMVYFDTETDRLLSYANGKWQADRTDAVIVAAGDSTQAEKDSADWVADGTSDEDEINAALTAASGGKVVLLAGNYTADASIIIPNDTTLEGVGKGTTIHLAEIDTTDNLIEATGTSRTGQVVRNLTLHGHDELNHTGTQYGISFTSVGGTTRIGGIIENVSVTDFRTTGIHLNAVSQTVVSGNHVKNNTRGIHVVNGGQNTVNGNVIEGSANEGIYSDIATKGTFTANTINGNGTRGIVVNGDNNIVNGNVISDNLNDGIWLTSNADNNVVSSNNFNNNGSTGSNDGIDVNGGDDNQITGNKITDTAGTGYAINVSSASSDNTYLADNVYSGTGATTINDSGTGTVLGGQSTGASGASTTFRQANSTTAFAVQNASGANVFKIDTTNSNLTVGTSDTTGTLLVLDTKTDSGDPSGINGAMYYNSSLGKFRCYENSAWVDCIGSGGGGGGDTRTAILRPEFEGAVLSGTGTGYMTSGACGNENDLSFNTTVCASGEKHSYYEWTSSEGSPQTYSIYVRYHVPSDFDEFSDDTTIKLFGRRSSSSAEVAYTMYQEDGTRCGTATTVTSSNDTWQEVSLTGNETSCSVSADDVITFQIDVSSQSDAIARVSALSFSYTTAF